MKREHLVMLYVLSRDTMLVLTLGFSGILVMESLLPGFISGRMSLSKIALITVVPAIAAFLLANRLSIKITASDKKMTAVRIIGYIFMIALIANSLRRFSFVIILISVVAFAIIVFLLEQNIESRDDQSISE